MRKFPGGKSNWFVGDSVSFGSVVTAAQGDAPLHPCCQIHVPGGDGTLDCPFRDQTRPRHEGDSSSSLRSAPTPHPTHQRHRQGVKPAGFNKAQQKCTVQTRNMRAWQLLLAQNHSPALLVSIPWLGLGGAALQECEVRAKPRECFPHYVLSVSGNLLLRDFLRQRLYPCLSALQHLMGLWREG